MVSITTKTIGECWIESIKTVVNTGCIFHDEDIKIIESLGLSVQITEPKLNDNIIEQYGDKQVLQHTLNKFKKGFVMDNRPFTYGNQIYNKDGIDQFEWLVNRLKRKEETKSATISLLDTGSEDANLPCLCIIDAKIRNRKLNLQFFYRGQNIVGRQYANLMALSDFQKKLCNELSTDIGFISGYIASAHIYEYDLEFAEKVIKNQNCVLKDHFYEYGPKSIRENNLFKQ